MGFMDFIKGKGSSSSSSSSSSSRSSSSGLNTGNYWIDNVTNLPLDGILQNRNEAELKDILKNDSNLHRRTFALSILFNIIDKDYEKFSEYFAHLAVELDIGIEDVKAIAADYSDLIDAMHVISKVMEDK